ncbi:hypothetical protein MKX01_036360, partial [Papaver californicum]
EHLCVVHEQCGVRMDIWSYKETKQKSSFTMGKSWSLEYSIPCNFPGNVEPFALTKSNKILLWLNE